MDQLSELVSLGKPYAQHVYHPRHQITLYEPSASCRRTDSQWRESGMSLAMLGTMQLLICAFSDGYPQHAWS